MGRNVKTLSKSCLWGVDILILVTLGTGDKPFPRILETLEKELQKGNIKDEVIVQAGCTKFASKYMQIFDLVSMDELNNLIKKCDILITHGGVGSILMGLKNNKKIIGVARLQKYGEVANDHQLQILENFEKDGLILYLKDLKNINKILKEATKFKPKKYKANNKKLIKIIEDYILNS